MTRKISNWLGIWFYSLNLSVLVAMLYLSTKEWLCLCFINVFTLLIKVHTKRLLMLPKIYLNHLLTFIQSIIGWRLKTWMNHSSIFYQFEWIFLLFCNILFSKIDYLGMGTISWFWSTSNSISYSKWRWNWFYLWISQCIHVSRIDPFNWPMFYDEQ